MYQNKCTVERVIFVGGIFRGMLYKVVKINFHGSNFRGADPCNNRSQMM